MRAGSPKISTACRMRSRTSSGGSMKSVWMSRTPRPRIGSYGRARDFWMARGPRRGSGRRSKLAAVVVGEADAVLAAAAHTLDGREEKVVVGEAEGRREEAVQALDARVEALDEDLQLVRLGRGARFVDLDPGRPQLDQRLQVGPDQVAGQVERELAPRLDLVAPSD